MFRKLCCLSNSLVMARKTDVQKWGYICGTKSFSKGSYGSNNIQMIKRTKKLVSTVLFGGTFLTVVLMKKRKKCDALKESILLPRNPHYHENVFLYKYKGFTFPRFVMNNMDKLQRFRCREDDVFVVSFPKTGTTWLQEIIFTIVNDLDFNLAMDKNIEDRFPYLEYICPGLATIEKMASPRLIKTHLPYSLLPPDVMEKKPKILCIMRNPKDVTVSYYYFVRMMSMTSYTGTFDDFFEDMIKDRVPYGPMWKHYADVWDHKNESNVLVVFYEDLHKDIHGSIKQIAEFLGKSLTDKEIEKVAEHCSFLQMAYNPSVNYEHWIDLGIQKKTEVKFMRKGEVGDWKNYIMPEKNKNMDEWIQERFFELSDHFIYSIL